MLNGYRFILYFVLAVKANKNPDYIGRYIHTPRYTKSMRSMVYTKIESTDKGKHLYINLMKRCGLKSGRSYIYNADEQVCEFKEKGFYTEFIIINNRSKKVFEKIKQEWKHVSIASLVAAYEYMGDRLFHLALEYVRRTDEFVN